MEFAIQAAKKAEAFTPPLNDNATSTMADAIWKMYNDLAAHGTLLASNLADKYFPDKPETKVPLAMNLALLTESSERTILLAANVGGDSDSVASIGGAIAGALRPDKVNDDWFSVVQAVNQDDLVEIAEALVKLRH
jgi:ADP-ribosylglycohydrolase